MASTDRPDATRSALDPITVAAPPPNLSRADERAHLHAGAEEWTFEFWTADGALAGVSGHRLMGRRAWYWAALSRAGEPLLHVGEWDIDVRPDPMIVKAEALWAEHTCVAPFEQWTIGNETYAAALDDPADGLDKAYGIPSPIAFDLEWYAIAPAVALDPAPEGGAGYSQAGVVHGSIEVAGAPTIEVSEIRGYRTHRWGRALRSALRPHARAHLGRRVAFAFPDGSIVDWVLTDAGWQDRSTADERPAENL